MSPDLLVDASLFMGMHSTDEEMRSSCKTFFVTRLTERLLMPMEQVGKCDDVVWRFPRSIQDAYYPFMDNLHTDMTFGRFGYSDEDVRAALEMAAVASPPVAERLVLAAALNRNAVLYTVNPRLMGHAGQSVRTPPICGEASFPDGLERLYRASLALRIPSEGR